MKVCIQTVDKANNWSIVNAMNTPFAENLRRARERQGLTPSELARAIGTTRQNIYSWETGRTSPALDVLPLLSDALGCSVDDLLRPPERPPD